VHSGLRGKGRDSPVRGELSTLNPFEVKILVPYL
jgi:hypothetical protein